MQKQLELLAPAGNEESFMAAVLNGADAIYLGMPYFNARQSADNFDEETLEKAINYAHDQGVKVYITLNTLIKNQEIVQVIDTLQTISRLAADAIIVQDLGIFDLCQRFFPGLAIHSSTQLTVNNPLAIDYLKDLKVAKVVLARENTLEEIASMAQIGVPLEVFVHGALCICYSGQCLLSSMIGGRSGNRGRCAQPCRLPYLLEDGDQQNLSKDLGKYLLSPKDLNTLDILPDLVEAGVVSFKIEGRMKRAEYVATVVRIYRKRLDAILADKVDEDLAADNKALSQIFNRTFSTGYLEGNLGRDLMTYERPDNRGLLLGHIGLALDKGFSIQLKEGLAAGDGLEIWNQDDNRRGLLVEGLYLDGLSVQSADVGDEVVVHYEGEIFVGEEVFKTSDLGLLDKARESYENKKIQTPGRPIDVIIEGSLDEPLTMTLVLNKDLSCQGQTTEVLQKALKRPLDRNIIEKKMRFGQSSFALGRLDIRLDDGLMIPISQVNGLRQRLTGELEALLEADLLKEKALDGRLPALNFWADHRSDSLSNPGNMELAVEVEDNLSAQQAIDAGADVVYIHLNKQQKTKSQAQVLDKGHAQVYGILPRVLREKDYKDIDQEIESLIETYDGFVAPSIGAIRMLQEANIKNIWGDFSLNTTNDMAIYHWRSQGLRGVCLSPELTLEEMGQFTHLMDLEVIIHGNFPLMNSAHCVVGAVVGKGEQGEACQMPCVKETYYLRDRKDHQLPLLTLRDCTMQVLNARELCNIETVEALKEMGMGRVRLTMRERSLEDIRTVTLAYRRAIDQSLNEGQCEKLKKQLLEISPYGLTRGHYFREVE